MNLKEAVRFITALSRNVDGCQVYVGIKDSTEGRRAYLRVDGKMRTVYSIMWEAVKGQPANQVLRHQCHNPRCWNLEHLLEGSQMDNARDEFERRGNSTGVFGVSYQASRERYIVSVYGRRLYLGYDFFEACCARLSFDASRRFQP